MYLCFRPMCATLAFVAKETKSQTLHLDDLEQVVLGPSQHDSAQSETQ